MSEFIQDSRKRKDLLKHMIIQIPVRKPICRRGIPPWSCVRCGASTTRRGRRSEGRRIS
jgi:hypothetical protein